MKANDLLMLRSFMFLTQRQLAALVGLSDAAICRMETGDMKISPVSERLFRALGRVLMSRVKDKGWRKQLARGKNLLAFLTLTTRRKGAR